MSINVNGNQNQIDLRKLMQARQSGKPGATRTQNKDPRMSMNGSIFQNRAQMVSGQNNSVNNTANVNGQVDNVANVNTTKSISGISNTVAVGHTQGAQGQDQKDLNIANIDFDNLGTLSTSELQSVQSELKSLVDGDAPFFLVKPFEQKLNKVNAEVKRRHEDVGDKLSEDNKKAEGKQDQDIQEKGEDSKIEAKNATNEGKAATRETEKGTETINKTSSDMKEQANSTKAAEKKMKKEMAQGTALMNKNAKQIEKAAANIDKITEQNEQTNAEIENIVSQIETKSAAAEESSNSVEGGEPGANNNGEIESLQQQITGKSNLVGERQDVLGKDAVKIKKLQSSSNKTIRRLTKSSNKFVKTMNANQKAAVASQQKQSDVLNVANKVDEISGYVATTGQMTQYAGKGMIIVGSHMITGGQALISAGMVVEKVGITTETVGNYGKCAANITKTAVYAAEGNIMGALTSAGTAVMTGASAVKGTKEIKSGFQSVNKEGAKAYQKLSDKADAKAQKLVDKGKDAASEQVKNLKDKAKTFGDKADEFKGKVNAYNDKQFEKAMNKAGKKGKEELGKMGAQGYAEAQERKIGKVMEFGNTLMTVGSQFGALNQQAPTGQTRVQGNMRVAQSRRRKIA